MRIASEPLNGQGAYGDLIYVIDQADPSQTIDVTIYSITDMSNEEGVKRLSGNSRYEVNIAPYLRRLLDPQPRRTGSIATETPAGWTVMGTILADGLGASVLSVTAGARNKNAGQLLSDAPTEQTLAPGECVDIACGLQYHTLNYDFARTLPNAEYLITPTAPPVRFRFVERAPGAVRLCWLNPYGGMDSYTFGRVGDERMVVKKSRAYTGRGYEVCGSTAEMRQTVRSDIENAETLRWLAQVVGSPRVWMCVGDTFQRVDIVTDSVALSDNAPGRLEITFRDVEKRKFQRS